MLLLKTRFHLCYNILHALELDLTMAFNQHRNGFLILCPMVIKCAGNNFFFFFLQKKKNSWISFGLAKRSWLAAN